jgi:SPP1 gp7 family putative phage head morphogenesis protein
MRSPRPLRNSDSESTRRLALSLDAANPGSLAKRRPPQTRRAERSYAQQLRLLAGHVGELIERFEVTLEGLPTLAQLLRAYAEHLVPWATRVASRMIAEVADRVRELLKLQVHLIKSIPTDAADRVHRLTTQALESSSRAVETTREIARSAEVTKSRATLIARTETARTATQLVRARAEFVGATHYVWRTAQDGAVRPGHRAMEGKTCAWADPPAVNEEGRIMHFHPGEVWNCRCYAEPVISNPYDFRARRRA